MTTLHEETLTDAYNDTTRSPEAQQETAVLAEATAVAVTAAASAADGSLSSPSNHKVGKTNPIDHQPLSSVEYGHL